MADNEISANDEKILKKLAQIVGISEENAHRFLRRCAKEQYLKVFNNAIADSKLTEEEIALLRKAADGLQIDSTTENKLVNATKIAVFRTRFLQSLPAAVTQKQLDPLRAIADEFSISWEDACRLMEKDVMEIIRERAASMFQDRHITADEEQELSYLREFFRIPAHSLADINERMQRIKLLQSIRSGKLPSVNAGILLEGGEVCHWKGSCRMQDAKGVRAGTLYLSSGRLIFENERRPFEVRLSKITNVRPYTNAVDLTTMSSKGTGRYFVDDGELLAQLAIVAIGYTNRQLVNTFDDERSRHVSQSVKTSVWKRDGGKCVQCGSNNDIHFDHIIPFSRGGANTVENIQILCARCNLAKGARI